MGIADISHDLCYKIDGMIFLKNNFLIAKLLPLKFEIHKTF
jgi:hypothetical protein